MQIERLIYRTEIASYLAMTRGENGQISSEAVLLTRSKKLSNQKIICKCAHPRICTFAYSRICTST